MTDGYKDALQRWERHVTWDADSLYVVDTVTPTKPEVVQFRWHLGTGDTPHVTGSGRTFTVVWADAELMFTAAAKLEIVCEPMPDETLRTRKWNTTEPDPLHTCLVVRTTKPVEQARITMEVRGK